MKKIVILAAGKGTRMKADLPKVLVKLKGKPMIEYLVESCVKSGVDCEPVIVVSPDNKELISQALSKYNCRYAIQAEQLGTGHALACAKSELAGADRVISFYGDHPFVSAATVKKLAADCGGAITMATVQLTDFEDWRQNFKSWGRVVRNFGQVKEIVEFKDASDAIKQVKEVNPGFYCFSSAWLWDNIDKLTNHNVQHEYYLTDLVRLAFEQKQPVNSISIDAREAVGINSKEELEVAEKLIL